MRYGLSTMVGRCEGRAASTAGCNERVEMSELRSAWGSWYWSDSLGVHGATSAGAGTKGETRRRCGLASASERSGSALKPPERARVRCPRHRRRRPHEARRQGGRHSRRRSGRLRGGTSLRKAEERRTQQGGSLRRLVKRQSSQALGPTLQARSSRSTAVLSQLLATMHATWLRPNVEHHVGNAHGETEAAWSK